MNRETTARVMNFGKLLPAFLLLAAQMVAGAQEVTFNGSVKSYNSWAPELNELPIFTQSLDFLIKGLQEHSQMVINPYFQVLDTSTIDWGIREAYIDLLGEGLELRVGKQVIAWGQAEGAFITDVVSPQDLRNFILSDFREIRKGIVGAKGAALLGDWTLEAVWIPWFEPATLPAAGSYWHTAKTPDLSAVALPEQVPENSEVFGRIAYFGSGWNGELVGGYAWEDLPTASGSPMAPSMEYQRLTMLGGSMSFNIFSVVFRLESAGYFNRSFTALEVGMPPALVLYEKNQIHGLAGMDFSILGHDFSAQYIAQYILEWESKMQTPEMSQTLTFRVRDSLLEDTLKVSFFAYVGIDPWDALLRPSVVFTPEDGVEVGLQGDFFLGDEAGRFGSFWDHDLASFYVKWYF